jgi:hypothetical protein
MIDDYNSFIKVRQHQIIIDSTFPKDLLIKIMKPYLELFITSQYSLLYTDRIQCKKLLNKKLLAFNKFNPLFGRKNYIKKNDYAYNQNNLAGLDGLDNSNTSERVEYSTKHISFYQIENDFMNNHSSDLIEDYDVNDIENDSDIENETEIDNDDEMTIIENIISLHQL